jgi:hypothetical protein
MLVDGSGESIHADDLIQSQALSLLLLQRLRGT